MIDRWFTVQCSACSQTRYKKKLAEKVKEWHGNYDF